MGAANHWSMLACIEWEEWCINITFLERNKMLFEGVGKINIQTSVCPCQINNEQFLTVSM